MPSWEIHCLQGKFDISPYSILCWWLPSKNCKNVTRVPERHRKFLRTCRKIDCTEVKWLCTLDIKSLYTNIPYEEEMLAVQEKLNENLHLSNRKISIIMSLLEVTLSKNYFRFGENFYLQTQGTLMGSPAVPSLANIFMANFEQKYVHSGNHVNNISTWVRYVERRGRGTDRMCQISELMP